MNTAKPTVAILGNGMVGVALAKGFLELGHPVVFGTRDVKGQKTGQALAAAEGATAQPYDVAARSGRIVVIALPWEGVKPALSAAGPENFAGKLVIDATNPLEFANGSPALAVGHTDSAGETVQRLLPAAKVVKAFNIINAAFMVHPHFPDGIPDMLIAGNDADAKAEVSALLTAFGWRQPIDMGDITASRLLEAFAMVWISYAFRNNHWTHGFSLLNRKS